MSTLLTERHSILFAAVGDVHGRHRLMLDRLRACEERSGKRVDFILQVGDFEAIRNAEDLDTVSGPSKYRKMGDFSDLVREEGKFRRPIYFIGGNHEPYGMLDEMPEGGDVAPGCTFVGRSGRLAIGPVTVTGLSGIFNGAAYEKPRPPREALFRRFRGIRRRDFGYFNRLDVERAFDLGHADILLLHEWPAGVLGPEHRQRFEGRRRVARVEDVGNEPARMLLDLLRPQLVLAGHMHFGHRATLNGETEFFGLSKVGEKGDIALFEVEGERIRPVEHL